MPDSRFFSAPYGTQSPYSCGKHLFFISACLTFVAMGFFESVYKPLAVAAVLGGVYLIMAWQRAGRPALPAVILLPVVFAIYIAILPGWPAFPDMILGDIALEMYVLGLALAVFFPQRAHIPPLFLVVCICGIFFYWLFASPPSFMFGGYRLQLRFNHPNVLGLMASWCLVFLICAWRQLPRRAVFFFAAAACCLGVAILLTHGRSTYLSILLTILGSCFLVPWKTFRKVFLIGMACWLLGYGALLIGGHDRLLPDVKQLAQEQSMQTRITYWEAAMDGFYAAPVTGLGHGTYGVYLDRYLDENYPEIKERPHYAHNMYVDVLYSWGLIGTVLLLAAFVPAVAEARRRREYFLPLSVLLMLGHGFFDSSLHTKAGLMVLFVPLGMLWGQRLAEILAVEPSSQYPPQ